MSVLIRGMEMPKNCGYCPLRHEARDGDECYLGASLTEYQKRPDDCPLVPVPEHGRLIDADALFDFILNIYKTAQGDARKAYRDVLDMVSCGGTIDEGYTGSIKVKLYNLGDEDHLFKAGDKIAQLVIMPYIAPELELVEDLEETPRGDNGFGSTGR